MSERISSLKVLSRDIVILSHGEDYIRDYQFCETGRGSLRC